MNNDALLRQIDGALGVANRIVRRTAQAGFIRTPGAERLGRELRRAAAAAQELELRSKGFTRPVTGR